MSPIDLQAIIAIIQTMDYKSLAKNFSTHMCLTYLKREEEEVHVPLRARYAVFVNDSHTDRSQTICSNRDGRVVCYLRHGNREDAISTSRRWPLER